MAYPLVKFTAAAGIAGAVRLDLNTDNGLVQTYPDADSIDLGTLQLEGEPDALGVEYGLREIAFDLVVKGTRAQATVQMSALARELVRESNWLMYQQDATSVPVWFRLFKSSPGSLALREIDNAKSTNYWKIGVSLHAEPLAYGERVTHAAVSVLNDAGSAQENLVPNPSLETNATGWTALSNCAVARSTAQFAIGAASLSMTATGAGSMTARTASGVSGISVTVGTSYTAQAKFRAAVTSRSVRVDIIWYTAAGATVSTSTGSTVADSNANFTTQASITATAPPTAAFAAVSPAVVSAAGSEVHYVDAVLLERSAALRSYGDGAQTGWTWAGTAHASASSANPMAYTLTTILGDAPAPCRVTVNPTNTDETPGHRWMTAHAALDAAYTPIFWQLGSSDGVNAGTDLGAAVVNAAYSGGSYRPVTFATDETLVTRIAASNAPSTPTRGKYKVLLRVARSDANSTFSLRFGQDVGGGYIFGDTVEMDRGESNTSSTGHATWVDLGDFNFPRGSGQVPDELVASLSAPAYVLQAALTSGTGDLYLDCFALIPIDILGQSGGSVLFSEFTRIGIDGGGGLGVWDGDAETFWAFNASAGLFTPMPANEGGYPVLYPGATNVFHIFQQVNGALPFFEEDSPDSITFSTSVVVSYHPRWLYIGNS